jgi:hypothetical protein
MSLVLPSTVHDPIRLGTETSMSAGDYIVADAWQDSGGSLAIDVAGLPAPWATIRWVRPL